MRESNLGTGFRDVDRAQDPTRLVSYLDATSALASIQAYKRQSFELLGLRPGTRVLEVGCGTGEDARAMAELVAPDGLVVALDSAETMVQQARERCAGLPVECRVGDVHALDFVDGSFDAVRADRVLQHVADPIRAFAELVRVVRPGGRVYALDPDWDTLVVDGGERGVTRRVTMHRTDRVRNGWMGRQLAGLAGDAGLVDLAVHTGHAILPDLPLADRILGLSAAAESAVETGLISADEAREWLGALDRAHKARRFFSALTAFSVVGTRPS